MKNVVVCGVNPHAQKKSIANATGVLARNVHIDGHDITVMIYGSGPTKHLTTVAEAIDALPFLCAFGG